MRQLDAAEAERLVNTYSDLILRLSYTYLKSTQDGEDICQTVLLKLLTGEEAFVSPEHEKAWVVRTTINACKDELRSFRRKAVPLKDAPEAAAPEPPRSDVLDAVMELPDKYREAIYLFYYEGYSIKEIAVLTGRGEAAVAAHLSRGRKKLRTMLGGSTDPNTGCGDYLVAGGTLADHGWLEFHELDDGTFAVAGANANNTYCIIDGVTYDFIRDLTDEQRTQVDEQLEKGLLDPGSVYSVWKPWYLNAVDQLIGLEPRLSPLMPAISR